MTRRASGAIAVRAASVDDDEASQSDADSEYAPPGDALDSGYA